ncbi:hypothetical protein F4818DRAFT_169850 [Hypoxylon cercidicola]|nr:hypothetical protein F4818DRAFT_169850 [Hypoxylon cercidicola]
MSELVPKFLDCLLAEATPSPHENDAELLRSFFAKRSANDYAVASKALSLTLALARLDGCISELQDNVIVSLIKSFDEKVLSKSEKAAEDNAAPNADVVTVVSGTSAGDVRPLESLPAGAGDWDVVEEHRQADSIMVSPAQTAFQKSDAESVGGGKPESASLVKSEGPKSDKDNLDLSQSSHAGAPNGVPSTKSAHSKGQVNTGTPQEQPQRRLPHEWRTPIPLEELQRMAASNSNHAGETTAEPTRPSVGRKMEIKDMSTISVASWGAKTAPMSENGGDPTARKKTPTPSESCSQIETPPTPGYTSDINENIRNHTVKLQHSGW